MHGFEKKFQWSRGPEIGDSLIEKVMEKVILITLTAIYCIRIAWIIILTIIPITFQVGLKSWE